MGETAVLQGEKMKKRTAGSLAPANVRKSLLLSVVNVCSGVNEK
jgi:hypothetical protein